MVEIASSDSFYLRAIMEYLRKDVDLQTSQILFLPDISHVSLQKSHPVHNFARLPELGLAREPNII